MLYPPPPGAIQAVQNGGGGASDKPSTFVTVLKWGLVVCGIWGIATIVRDTQKTALEVRRLVRPGQGG